MQQIPMYFPAYPVQSPMYPQMNQGFYPMIAHSQPFEYPHQMGFVMSPSLHTLSSSASAETNLSIESVKKPEEP